MKRDRLLRHTLVAFGIALLIYVTFYTAIEHRRIRTGPWQVTFTNNTASAPAIIINQPALGITNVQVSFVGESNALPEAARTLQFGEARAVPFEVPFGKCAFLDTTFLPGTVALNLFGHEVQLLPRVLTVDRVEHAWHSGERFAVPTTVDSRIAPN
jgi:hypothetical protein